MSATFRWTCPMSARGSIDPPICRSAFGALSLMGESLASALLRDGRSVRCRARAERHGCHTEVHGPCLYSITEAETRKAGRASKASLQVHCELGDAVPTRPAWCQLLDEGERCCLGCSRRGIRVLVVVQ